MDTEVVEKDACAVCKHDWPQDSSCTLLCEAEIGCDLEFHTYCLDPPLKEHPGEHRKWLCPACHYIGKSAELKQYFDYNSKSKMMGCLQSKFREMINSPAIIGNCIRLTTLRNVHTGNSMKYSILFYADLYRANCW